MTIFAHISASLLDQSATALGGHAANLLLEEYPDTAARFAPNAFRSWREQLAARVRELSIAVEFAAPELFASSVDWARVSFQKRDVPQESLRNAILCLQRIVTDELPESEDSLLKHCFEMALATFETPVATEQPLDASDDKQRLALVYLERCLSGYPREATDGIMQAVDAGLAPEVVSDEVISHALREVGRLWHSGQLGVHEEHLVTSTTLSLLTLLAQRTNTAARINKSIVGAAAGDNSHDLGLRVIMEAFAAKGWRTIGLGGHLPIHDIATAARDFKADVLVLSATLITHLVHVRATIEATRSVSPHTKILVGGLALGAAPDLWQQLHADACAANASEAVREASQLTGLS